MCGFATPWYEDLCKKSAEMDNVVELLLLLRMSDGVLGITPRVSSVRFFCCFALVLLFAGGLHILLCESARDDEIDDLPLDF